MGEVEQMRLRTPGTGQVATAFEANDEVEQALIRDVQTALGNLTGYLARRRSCDSEEAA